ncbi:MAG: putative metal-binding motif-containing protein, partial [Myxococcota bacterium]
MNVRPLAFALLMLAGCSGPTQPTSAACDDNSDCAEGLVCRAAQCVECGGDQDCPGHAGCGLTTPGRCGCRDADGDGHSCDDCDDVDARRFPGAPESCDEVDNDCDGVVDEDVLTRWYSDDDGDGFGNDALSISRCVAPLGFVARGGDCGDLDPTIAPGAPEVCDGRDNDCDGETDEAVRVTYFRDSDGDGFGDPRNAVSVCQIPAAGFVTMGGDCDDSRADANPEALETCNGRDDDCDGVVDRVTRSCANACGDGLETCTRGVWGGCTAPPILTVSNQLNVTAPASFACVVVTGSGRLAVAADAGVHVTGWLHTEGVAVV